MMSTTCQWDYKKRPEACATKQNFVLSRKLGYLDIAMVTYAANLPCSHIRDQQVWNHHIDQSSFRK